MIHEISAATLSLSAIEEIVSQKKTLVLSADAKARIEKCRNYLDEKMAKSDAPIYGINTGFGSLYNRSISREDLSTLQENLVKSHACGTGEEVPAEIVKLMLLLKIQGLSYGHSGVQLKTVNRLVDMYNADVLPVIYQQGSLGASGDLAPLAHMSLPLLGLGEVSIAGSARPTAEVWKEKGWEPIQLKSKEGLALLNGTQFMSSYATWCLLKAHKLSGFADVLAALSLEAYDGRIDPFTEAVHLVRPHRGQLETAAHIRALLEGSEMISAPKKHVQDPYSFRCVPQVHGASKDALRYISTVVETEVNSVTDNPTVFPDLDMVVSAGNFHGQPLALVLDQMCIAMAELGSISERRTYKLISGSRDLPPFLVKNPGLNSGFMIPQYTAASIVSQNKQLCSPASIDTIDSSHGQEDHVSMGANAATKLYRVIENVSMIMAIELFNAAQAISFRRPARTSVKLEALIEAYRKSVPLVENDVYMHEYMKRSKLFLESWIAQWPPESLNNI